MHFLRKMQLPAYFFVRYFLLDFFIIIELEFFLFWKFAINQQHENDEIFFRFHQFGLRGTIRNIYVFNLKNFFNFVSIVTSFLLTAYHKKKNKKDQRNYAARKQIRHKSHKSAFFYSIRNTGFWILCVCLCMIEIS